MIKEVANSTTHIRLLSRKISRDQLYSRRVKADLHHYTNASNSPKRCVRKPQFLDSNNVDLQLKIRTDLHTPDAARRQLQFLSCGPRTLKRTQRRRIVRLSGMRDSNIFPRFCWQALRKTTGTTPKQRDGVVSPFSATVAASGDGKRKSNMMNTNTLFRNNIYWKLVRNMCSRKSGCTHRHVGTTA